MDLLSDGQMIGQAAKIPIIIIIIILIFPISIIHDQISEIGRWSPSESGASSPKNATSSFPPPHDSLSLICGGGIMVNSWISGHHECHEWK